MRAVTLVEFAVTLDAAGAGTVDSAYPVSGRLVEVRLPNAATALVGTGSTADISLTRVVDGGTVGYLLNTAAPAQVFNRGNVTTLAGGTTAYAVGVGPVSDAGGDGGPVDGYVRCTVGTGAISGAGTVYTYWAV